MKLSMRLGLFSMLLGIGLSLIGGNAYAQNINGIFGTRSSEQFFQAGIERMEEEIRTLQHPIDDDGEVLMIDESVEDQRHELEEGVAPNNSPSEPGPEAPF